MFSCLQTPWSVGLVTSETEINSVDYVRCNSKNRKTGGAFKWVRCKLNTRNFPNYSGNFREVFIFNRYSSATADFLFCKLKEVPTLKL